jgi:hypothetical protein
MKKVVFGVEKKLFEEYFLKVYCMIS